MDKGTLAFLQVVVPEGMGADWSCTCAGAGRPLMLIHKGQEVAAVQIDDATLQKFGENAGHPQLRAQVASEFTYLRMFLCGQPDASPRVAELGLDSSLRATRFRLTKPIQFRYEDDDAVPTMSGEPSR